MSSGRSILAFGDNSFGQLGISDFVREKKHHMCKFASTNTRTAKEDDAVWDEVVDVQCGFQYTCILNNNGAVHFTGQLNGNVATIPRVIQPAKCVQIACGRKHVLVLLEGGFVFSWGVGYFGQLGHGDDTSWDTPKIVKGVEPQALGMKVVKVSCGGSHSAAITESGKIFMWGLNKSGQCGMSNKSSESIMEPRPMDMGEVRSGKTVQVVCGRNHSSLVTTEGRVFTWGASGFGRLGLGSDSRKVVCSPTEVSLFRNNPVHTLASGDFHMVALTQDCTVYSWGYGGDGQCGHGNLLNVRSPTRVEAFDGIQVGSITCGSNFTMAVTTKGDLYAWGYGDGGWLGMPVPKALTNLDPDNPPDLRIEVSQCMSFDSRHNVLVPLKVRSLDRYDVESVRCGAAHTVVFCSKRSGEKSADTKDGEDIDEDGVAKVPVAGLRADSGFGGPPPSESKSFMRSPYSVDSKSGTKEIASSPTGQAGQSLSHLVTLDISEINAQLISWCRHRKIFEIQYVLTSKPEVDVNIRDAAGNTPLIVSCQNGHFAVAKLLLKHGASVNLVNNKGNSALHFSMAYGFEDISQYLLEQGADDLVTNSDGLTCYEGLTKADLDKY